MDPDDRVHELDARFLDDARERAVRRLAVADMVAVVGRRHADRVHVRAAASLDHSRHRARRPVRCFTGMADRNGTGVFARPGGDLLVGAKAGVVDGVLRRGCAALFADSADGIIRARRGVRLVEILERAADVSGVRVDETPHLAALALFPIALVSWARLLESPGRRRLMLAVVATAVPVLANTFGAMQLAIALVCLVAARPAEWRTIATRIVPVAALAYALVSPWLPPSLIAAMMRNSNAYPEGAVAGESVKVLVALAAVFVPLAWLLNRAIVDWAARFWVLMAFTMCAMVAMFHHLGWRLVPQAGRYRSEAELAIAMAVVFVAPLILKGQPMVVRVALAAAARLPRNTTSPSTCRTTRRKGPAIPAMPVAVAEPAQ